MAPTVPPAPERGQASLAMEGMFFTPPATADYAGTSRQNQTKARSIEDRLAARRQGTPVVRPSTDRAIPSGFPVTILIADPSDPSGASA